MSKLLYNLSIYGYQWLIRLVSPFNSKANLWIEGRKRFEKQVSTFILKPNTPLAWFHCASLGEFEQARPVIEQYRKTFPQHQLLLTFFSPSGYEIRKNYEGADFICYLPADTPANARQFIEHFKPAIAFFVKYEFWYNYLHILNEKQIPIISFSAIFRPNQVFFAFYGGFYRKMLAYFSHIFVQNQASLALLQSIGLTNCSVGGDTRFDRVKQIADAKKTIAIAEIFKDNKPLLIVGSCWQEDLAVIAPVINTFQQALKLIIAPHEIHEETIERWQKMVSKKSIRFSEATKMSTAEIVAADVLIIDNIGMLSSLYQYANFAWIGGAYGKGLHNTLEAATFGLPIFFGHKKYQKFQEALDLEALGGAKVIPNSEAFKEALSILYNNPSVALSISNDIIAYVQQNLGSTEKVITLTKKIGIN